MYTYQTIHNVLSKLYNRFIVIRPVCMIQLSQCNNKKITFYKTISNNYTTRMEELEQLRNERTNTNKIKFDP